MLPGLTSMRDEGIAHTKRYVELTEGRTHYALGYLGYAYGMAGQRNKALQPLELPAAASD
jgi:hypothetical protein